MGLFTSARAQRRGRVTFLQLVSSLAGFLLFSVLAGVLLAGLALPGVTVASQAANGTSEIFESLPEEFNQTKLPEKSSIYANDGTTLLATFFDQNRVVVPLEDISPWMQKAQVAVEDKRFWEHQGVDGEGLARVAMLMARGEDPQGASTITQQLVKNMLLQAAVANDDYEAQQAAIEASVTRKVREWRLALAYEEKLNAAYEYHDCTPDPKVDCGKEQVLESYLNIAQYGTRVYGVEAAAQFYFGISAKELNALQAATIAGITQNPTKWDPVRNPDNAQVRRNIVLAVMHDQELITDEEYDVYRQVPLEATLNVTYPKFSCAASTLAPFFCDYVTKVIIKDPAFNDQGGKLLYEGGLKIVTTLDPRMQQEANDALRRGIPASDPSGIEDALVSLDVTTGNILAMAQNRDFDPSSQAPFSTAINYSTDRDYGGSRGFSPGSSFKPVILAEWLDSGRGLNQVVSGDVREWQLKEFTANCAEGGGFVGKWKPQNSEPSENGQTNILNATAYSINTAYVSMAHQLDLCLIRDMASSLGFHRADGLDFEVVPSISLGTQNASPLTMASVYQTFANRGVHCAPRAILRITDLDDNPVLDPSTNEEVVPPAVQCNQAIDPEVADGVTFAMSKVLEYGTAKRVNFDRPAAGKTGTAQNNTHLWFVGFTPGQIVTAVWAGNADIDQPLQDIAINGSRVRSNWYGGDIPAPIWADYMTTALEGYPVVGLPAASPRIMGGVPAIVPDVFNIPEKDAQHAINDAGFLWELSPQVLYRPDVPAGTIVDQYPDAGTSATTGSTVTYFKSTDVLPGWWYNWPSGWDPLTAPSDYWGSTWPPDGWVANNPSNGWDPAPAPSPTPGP